MFNKDNVSNMSGNSDAATVGGPSLPDPNTYSHGYQKLSCLMAKLPEFAIYRRFGRLNSLNLLYLQSELHDLEETLYKISQPIACSTDKRIRMADLGWRALSNTDKAGPHNEQYKLVLRIREVLKEYNEQLWLQSQIARLPKPYNTDITWLRSWMFDPLCGGMQCPALELKVFTQPTLDELVVVKAREYSDAMTTWFATSFIHIYHKYLGKYIHKDSDDAEFVNNIVYTERSNSKFMSVITTSLSSAFPVLSVVILNQCNSINLRLGILTVFTICFSAVLAFLSPKKKLEVFAASAAYAAVNVVFIHR
ncbi:hypothetical protein LTR05_000448 [Lithohypha guttulata]|uniref:DUF6594 domain-containing protein n=1 Tax=Lithohypha guttulata TaxID=1690604 RepID=A0AAN7T5W4_9EURO|nr:hypothetical protein LTR05_000448 [Lithohypha guttulata]